MEKLRVVFGKHRVARVLFFVFTITLVTQFSALAAKNVTLAWDASTDAAVTGYKIHYGGVSRTYTNEIVLGKVTSGTVSNLTEGATYLFSVTAFNGVDLESDFSSEISYTVPTTTVINQPPTLNTIAAISINEDAAAQSVSLSGIGSGSASESQTLTITAASSNTGLIPNPTVTYTSPNATGTLSFTPVANATGTATITVTVNDGQAANNTLVRTFVVTVNAVNDAPTLNTINSVTLNEDAAAQTVSLSGIGAGVANETQTLSVTATSSNPSLIPNPTVTYTSPNATGSLAFTPVADANGTATITVTVNDGQAANNTVSQTFTVTVNAVNDVPTLGALSAVNIAENAAQQTVNLAGIGTGAANETQTLSVTATSSNPSLIPNPTVSYTSPNTTGLLTFTPVTDANGSATITVTVNDGQAANNTVTRTFLVTVSGVNNAPTLNTLNNVTVNEDAGAQTVSLSGIGTGAANETQTLSVTATSSNPSLIPNPAVTYSSPNATGSLSFTPAADANGTATITVTVNDGQAANNTVTQTFTVTVNAVNDVPTLNTLGNLSIADNAGLQTVNLTGIGTGAANEAQTLAVTATSSNPSLIPNPTVSYTSPSATGALSFTPVSGGSGSATITVTVNDGQAANNTVVRTFTVAVNAVNNAPTLNGLSNVTLNEDATAQTVNLTGIGAGAAFESQTLTITATSSNPSLIPNPTVNYTSPNTAGTLSFTPVADANGSATITVTINDGQLQNNTLVRTFLITVNAVNDAPTLTTLGNLNIAENATLQTVNLAGIGTGAANETQTLSVTASSSNTGLIPNPTVSYTSPNSTGTLSFTPVTDANGTATITVTVNDGQAANNTVTRTFTVAVSGVNNTPTLSALNNLTLSEDAGSQTVNITGIGTGAANETQTLSVTATSDNPGLIPNPSVSYTSPNATGSLTFASVTNASGTATITVTVNDGQSQNNTLSRTFTVNVTPINDPPTLDGIAGLDFGTPGLNSLQPKTVTLTGIGAGAANENQTITVTASSSNPSVVPNPTVNYTSPNSSGTLTVMPVSGVSGAAVITVAVNDGGAQNNITTRTFTVRVNSVNNPPTISAIADQVTPTATPTSPIPFTIGDGETFASNLIVFASSSNPSLVSTSNIVFGGSGSNRSLTITPLPSQTGTATITVTVSDGSNTASTNFLLDVTAPAATPTLTVTTNGTGTVASTIVPSQNSIGGQQVYQLTATAGAGQMFTGWSGGTNSTSPTITVAVRSSLVMQANFSPLNLAVNGTGVLWPDLKAQANLSVGKDYSVTAYPGAGQIFAGWSGTASSSSPTVKFVMDPNVRLTANFVPSPYFQIAGNFSGLLYESDEVRQHSSGNFSAYVNQQGFYSGWIQLGSARQVFYGQLGADCSATNVIGQTLTLELHFGTGDQTNRVTGRLVGANFVSILTGDRAVFGWQNPAPTAGNYTMVIPGQKGQSNAPAGDGAAMAWVFPNGLAYLVGTLGDGTPVTQSTYVSKEGNWPFYTPLYSGWSGSVLGWLSLSNRLTDDLSGTLNWIKPALAWDQFYKDGFTNQSQAIGSRFAAPTNWANNVLSLTNAVVDFSGGNLDADFSNLVRLDGYGRVSNLSSNSLSLSMITAYGMYWGLVNEPGTTKNYYYQGVVLQKQNIARGLLRGANQTSQVLLQSTDTPIVPATVSNY